MNLNKLYAVGASVTGLLVWTGFTPAYAKQAPTDPYPIEAAGWGPEAGNGLFVSRWAEDWTKMNAAGVAPPFKAMPLTGDISLTLSAEARLRYDAYTNGQLMSGNDYRQSLLRSILGADLRFNPNVRVYGEIGSGQVDGRSSTATPGNHNPKPNWPPSKVLDNSFEKM